MTPSELCYTSATALAGLIRSKAVSPVEVVRAVLDRIERLNPLLNAYCTVIGEEALEAARQAEHAVMADAWLGPLHGVPFSVKDLAFTKGVRTMSGSFIFQDRVPEADAPFVPRLKEAGGIMVGKTTSPEFGWKALGDSPLTGITRNPWHRAMTSGGSSAGAAAAVAAGLAPLAQGSDGAGSIRIPASFCGIYGFKPSFGRVPMWPVSNNDYLTHNGPMTRTVADAALMLSVMAGPDDSDRTCLDGPPDDYVGRLRRDLKGVRVAWSPNLDGLRVDAEVALLVRNAVRTFADLGCVVEEVKPQFADTRELIRIIWSSHEAGNRGPFLARWRDRMDPGLVACIEHGLRHSLVDYIQARDRKLMFCDTVRPLFDKYALLVTPTVSVAAFAVMRLNPEGFPQHDWDWFDWASFSYPFNFTGQPAATVPAGATAAGLPVGLQIVGPPHADLTVLQASAAYEAAHPWIARRPPDLD